MVEAAAARLKRDAAEVDALNVYPLPDGDTGRNMYQTIAAALVRAREAGPSVREVSDALARGALMGARGNGGVILSQIIRGFREAFAESETAGGAELREAFVRARLNAYAAVDRPADGTMLSLCSALEERVPAGDDVGAVLRTALEVGAEALGRTMEDNPMNRAAGVVDAGAYGIWVLLLGALEKVDPSAARRVEIPPLRRPGAAAVVAASAMAPEVASWTGGHCVQYLVQSPRRKPEELRREMLDAGADSVLVVGDESVLKVHAHAVRPETITAIGESAGALEDLVVEDFDTQVAEHERATGIVLRSPPRPLAAIVVVPGDGFAEIVRSFYATPLRGGATMNPSVGELVEAIRAANAKVVAVLPNDRNVILAAREAARESGEKVEVLETRSVAQGMAALVPFDPMAGLEAGGVARSDVASVVARMREAAAATHGIEVTRATRDTTVDGVEVRQGDAIALVDGKLVARAADEVEALELAARWLVDTGPGGEPVRPEALVVYAGEGVDEEEAERAAERLRATLDGVEVEVRRGGQPHYPFIVQVE